MGTIQINDKILVQKPSEVEEVKFGIIWEPEMDAVAGKEVEVEFIDVVGHIKPKSHNVWLHPSWCQIAQ